MSVLALLGRLSPTCTLFFRVVFILTAWEQRRRGTPPGCSTLEIFPCPLFVPMAGVGGGGVAKHF